MDLIYELYKVSCAALTVHIPHIRETTLDITMQQFFWPKQQLY